MSLDTIRELRDITGMSFHDIKNALAEAGGDKLKALGLLKMRGAAIAEKKASRATREGIVESYVHATRKIATLVEILCETDFVARNPLFLELAHELALHITAMNPRDVDELLSQPFIKNQDQSVSDFLTSYIAKLGENIQIGRFVRFAL